MPQFSIMKSLTFLSLATLAFAAPTNRRSIRPRQSGPVLASTTFNDISIAAGAAGNGKAEALAVFSALDLANPKNIDEADIDFLGQVNDVANDAETDVFNPAIEAADGAQAESLQAGKIKNKILKLTATKIELEAKLAQGEDVGDKLEEELTKLNNNIAIDEKNAGLATTAVDFDAEIMGGAVAGNDNNDNDDNDVDDNHDNDNAKRFRTRDDANNKVALPGNRGIRRRDNKRRSREILRRRPMRSIKKIARQLKKGNGNATDTDGDLTDNDGGPASDNDGGVTDNDLSDSDGDFTDNDGDLTDRE